MYIHSTYVEKGSMAGVGEKDFIAHRLIEWINYILVKVS